MNERWIRNMTFDAAGIGSDTLSITTNKHECAAAVTGGVHSYISTIGISCCVLSLLSGHHKSVFL